jgi:hypothetical protein
MTDETPAQAATPEPQAGDGQQTETEPVKTARTLDELQADLKKKNSEARNLRERLIDAEAKLVTADKSRAEAEAQRLAEQGKYQELYEAEKKRAADFENQVAALNDRIRAQELAALRQRIANEKKLPAALADRLQGETADEIAADADKLLEALPRPAATPLNGGERGLTGGGPSEAEARHIASRFAINPRYLE